ncbi:serum paraoxonase/arylesterase 2-like [Hyla sarda]|uniref:serum paraoxonase/arylesterase 2-like n=1 Tax=Hyla sarda TaxID=327740 RepID=UPI0024C44461|nr:serum paraoxonase/arylesterase 2-like [Hyla sarda]
MGALLKITLVGVLLALLGERITHFCHRFLVFNEVVPVELPGCQLVKGIEAGSEDIDVLPNGLAFISTGLKFPNVKSFAPDDPGEIVLLDLEDGDLSPVPLRISEGFDVSSFNPHGLSTYIDEKDGTVYLFVVNHPQLQSIVEIFKFQEEERSLLHLKSVKHELLSSVNDIVAVGPESFYATIDFYFTNANMKFVEMYLGFPWTGVVYYSPGDVRQVATGLYNGNGIAISNDKKYIYAADFTHHTINVFKKNKDWSLTPVKVVDVNSILDNLSVDPVTGDIWTGAHPNLYKLFNYSPDDPPGSEVIRVQNIHSDNPIITRVYANNGSVIQGSSCASVYKGQLLVGTVFHRALHCPLK